MAAEAAFTQDGVLWWLLLAVMAWPRAWYYGKKRDRPNLLTRYF
jgi:hypothetical protein